MDINKTKNSIRSSIIQAAEIYSSRLAGKVFLYIYGEKYIEIMFPVQNFIHLTGVDSDLFARDFYKKSKDATITTKQFKFDRRRHPMNIAKKKLQCLQKLPNLTNDTVCILDTLTTPTFVYKIALTNLEFTLGLMEHTDRVGNKVFAPRSLRVNDKSIERSGGGEFVDFIFVRDASRPKYSLRTYEDKAKEIPEVVKSFII